MTSPILTLASTVEHPADLAAHFKECGSLDANLTLAPGERMVITDDVLGGAIPDFAAMTMAAIVARDTMVARAAILPLGVAANRVDPKKRIKYEKLFKLIEDTAFDSSARESAEALIHSKFREGQIRDLVHELGGVVQPARLRYRAFLEVVKKLSTKQVSEALFLDEFREFTRAVAGKLDFGIYSVCVDRMFISPRIEMEVKAALLDEVMKYPPMIRKELITNLLSSSFAPRALVEHARHAMSGLMTRDQLTEIILFTTLKLSWAAQRKSVKLAA